jgi:para-nitrobenzyl esterase
MIIGNTHDETRAFLGGDPRNFTITWEELPERLAPELVLDVEPRRVIARYRELYPDYTPSEVFFAATTAGRSWPGHLIQAEQRARIGAPAWMYQLDFGSPIDGNKLRAFHSFDIALVFGNLDKPGSKTGTGPAARKVSDQMSEAFLAFARTGDPNCAAIPAWGKYTLPQRSTLVINETSQARSHGKLSVGAFTCRFIFSASRAPAPAASRTVKAEASTATGGPSPTATLSTWCSP